MSVSNKCCMLSGGGLSVWLITRPEESYLVWCVCVDRESSTTRRPRYVRGCIPGKHWYIYIYIRIYVYI